MVEDAGSSAWGEAEKVFLEYLEARGRGEDPDFEEICRRHPHLEALLRDLNDQFVRVNRILGRVATGEESGEPLGEGAPDVVSLRHSRYWVRKVIDRGGQGEVLLVWDPDIGRRMALKRVRAEFAQPGSSSTVTRAESRLVEEAQITGQLAHPGIVPVHEVGADAQGRAYFTMELVRGQEFARVIPLVRGDDESWSLPGALRVLLQVCNAVAHAHSKGVIHRDLKPSNVMVGRLGETYVMDWGFARVLEDRERDASVSATEVETGRTRMREHDSSSPLMTHDGDVFGTPPYMSPEQARGSLAEMGPQSDVYSVGAMLYHLLTGQPPYHVRGRKPSALELIERVKSGPPEPVREIDPHAPEELVEICEKAMARNASDRYPDMSAMAADLEAYLDRRPISARPAGLLYVLRLAFQRNRKLALTVGFAAMVLGLVSVLYVLRLRQANARTSRQLDFYSAGVFEAEAAQLVPPTPDRIGALDGWLARADDLLSRQGRYERELERAGPEAPAQLAEAVATLRRVALLREELGARRAVAAGLRERTLDSEAEAWRSAADAIAALPVYDGLQLTPQIGLVPLGPDPVSGLWEFWSVLSGDRPTRGADGRITMSADSGIVLVLIPGGRFRMGSPPDELDRMSNEQQQEATVPAFFLSKFEVTQGQWERTTGRNPSYYAPGPIEMETPSGGVRAERVAPSHPVENVTWHDVEAFARRLDLRLPSEAEWEYAARAGTSGMHSFGNRYEDLAGLENVRDLSLSPTIGEQGGGEWNDGFAVHAPVGRFAANRFGLCDVHGNVSEWCHDELREAGQSSSAEPFRIFRGGSWLSPLFTNRAAYRNFASPGQRNQALGVRPARDLELASPERQSDSG